MKKIIASALVLALSVSAVQAQTSSTKDRKDSQKENKQDRMQQLKLSEEQRARLKAIRESQKAEMKALKEQALNAEQTKEKRKAIHEKYRTEMQSVLNAEQKAQLEQMKAQRKENGKKGKFTRERKGPGAMGFRKGATGSFGNLNLTTDQQAKMKSVREQYKGQFEAIRADQSSTREQKRARMQELMKSQQEEIRKILTKEQLQQIESKKKQRPERNTK